MSSIFQQLLAQSPAKLVEGATLEDLQQLLVVLPQLQLHVAKKMKELHPAPPSRPVSRQQEVRSGRGTPSRGAARANHFFGPAKGRDTPSRSAWTETNTTTASPRAAIAARRAAATPAESNNAEPAKASQPSSPGPSRTASRAAARAPSHPPNKTPSRTASRTASRAGSRAADRAAGTTTVKTNGARYSSSTMSLNNPFNRDAPTPPPQRVARTYQSPRSQLTIAHHVHQPSSKIEEEKSDADFKKMGEADRIYMAKFKEQIQKFASGGIKALAAIFKRFDTNRDGMIDAEELQDGLAALGYRIRGIEAKRVLFIMDRDQSGLVSYDEFLRELRGALNNRRLHLIEAAFDKFDVNGDGTVDKKDLHGAYDASKHPKVISGEMTHEEAHLGFINGFEKYSKHPDGIITKDEFIEYYRWVSSNIDDDDYFELMIRNAWHLSGGEGQYENTANRRVLVTHLDGAQEVVEIQNDMGLSSNPTQAELKARLKRQGCTMVATVKLHG